MAFQVAVEQVVIRFGDLLDHPGAPLRRLALEVGRDIDGLRGVAELVGPDDRFLLDQVDHAHEIRLEADRHLHRDGVGPQALPDHVQRSVIGGADAVHLVDEADARDAIPVGLAPDRLGLRLDALDGVEDHDPAVEHAQAALDFGGEIDVAGSIDDIDDVVAPGSRDGRRNNGDAALAFLLHPIRDRRPVIDRPNAVRPTGIEEHPLGGRGFAGIDVGNDPDVSIPVESNVTRHDPRRNLLRSSSVLLGDR